MTKSLVGNLLVASTSIDDAVFAQSVCLVVHHDHEGAIGLVLNRPLTPQPHELLSLLGAESPNSPSRLATSAGGGDAAMPAPGNRTVHFGGPLSGPVVALHALPALAEAETTAGVYVAAEKNHLEKLLKHPQAAVRLIVGHAGWGAGQLESEIAAGSWHVMPATTEIVFSLDQAMWGKSLRRAAGNSVARWVGARPLASPELN